MAITPYRASTDLFSPLLEDFLAPLAGANRTGNLMRAPLSDVIETEEEIRVITDMPGLRVDDISIDLENNVLTISGERQEERTEGNERNTWHLSERRYGRFSRSFVLPRDVESERIHARFEDGVLTVNVPKSEKARRRWIDIQGGDGQSRRVEAKASPEQQ